MQVLISNAIILTPINRHVTNAYRINTVCEMGPFDESLIILVFDDAEPPSFSGSKNSSKSMSSSIIVTIANPAKRAEIQTIYRILFLIPYSFDCSEEFAV
ncbi:hypothetical protein BpHYR1_005268, partial [Brachionus plicatilis]